jgi:hypothetical protein
VVVGCDRFDGPHAPVTGHNLVLLCAQYVQWVRQLDEKALSDLVDRVTIK